MTEALAGDIIYLLEALVVFTIVLSICCVFSDCVLPRFTVIERKLLGLFGLSTEDFEEEDVKSAGNRSK